MTDDAPRSEQAPDIPPTHRRVGHLSRRLFQVYRGMIEGVLEGYGLDIVFYSVLAELAETPGLDQKTLGQSLGIDRTAIGEIVEALETMGFLERRVNPEDRRARILNLTANGRTLRDTIRPAMLAAQERLLSPLAPGEREPFVDMMYRVVVANLAHETRGGWGRRKRNHNRE